MVKKLYYWKPIPRRLAGRPEIRWENDIKRRFKNCGSKLFDKMHNRIGLNGRKWLRRPELSNGVIVAPE
jgi:hypothetical protein